MKALTLMQPWASFVVHGLKTVETRSWKTKHRGWLAIHASQRISREARELCQGETFSFWLKHLGYTVETLPTGVVLGKANLISCSSIFVLDCGLSNLPVAFEQEFGDYTPGRFAWRFASIVRYEEPIPAKGRLGLWNWQTPWPPEEEGLWHTIEVA